MDLTPKDEQETLRSATVDWLADNMPLDQARARPDGIWQGMEDMGWFGLTTGAIGLDHATEALLFAELGRFLAPVSAISTAVALRWSDTEGKVALSLGERILDAGDTGTALGLFDGKAGLVSYQAAAAEPSLDLSTAQIILDDAPEPVLLSAPEAVLHFRLLTAAYAVGCAEAAGAMATDYAKIREQFGKPIGSFQAIKHMCADMAVRSQVSRSQLYYAACALDGGDPDVDFHVGAAKRLADQAALENGRANIQIHGGIGMTDEALAQFPLKRAHLLQFIAPTAAAELL